MQWTANRIDRDVNDASEVTLRELLCDRVNMDTICLYCSYIIIPDVKYTAYIAMKTVWCDGWQETILIAEAGCGFMTLAAMSDWKVSGLMMATSLLWLLTGTAISHAGATGRKEKATASRSAPLYVYLSVPIQVHLCQMRSSGPCRCPASHHRQHLTCNRNTQMPISRLAV